MNVSNREELINTLRQVNQPDPAQQEAAQQQLQLQVQQLQSQINAFNGQAQESAARASKYSVDAEIDRYKAQTDRIKVLSTDLQPGDQDEIEFQRRAKIAELYLKEQEVNTKKEASQQGVINADTNRDAEDSGSNQQQVRLPEQPNRQVGEGTGVQ
jgi:hypothetical protein